MPDVVFKSPVVVMGAGGIPMLSIAARGALALVVCGVSGSAMAQSRLVGVRADAVEFSSLRGVEMGSSVRIERLEVGGVMRDLRLDRVDVLEDGAELWVGTESGLERREWPEVVVLSGFVEGEPDSLAYVAVSEWGTNGFVEIEGVMTSISTGPVVAGRDLVGTLKTMALSELDGASVAPSCGYEAGHVHLEPFGGQHAFEGDEPIERMGTTCQIAQIAIETDYEFTDRLFNGNTNASAAYALSLMGAVSEIYERDVNVRLSVPFVRVWGANNDPYTAGGDPLDEVRNHWRANMNGVQRTLVHYLTGKQNMEYGGVAYLSTMCSTQWGYGVSGYLNGFFPYPLVDHSGNWDIVVAAHELGHNFGTGHTHDSYTPVIDGCGNGNCAGAFGGTIMSYCHTCAGGIQNIVLNFHPRVQTVIENYLTTIPCNIEGVGVSGVDDFAQTFQGSPVNIDVLVNDMGASCDAIGLASVSPVSASGGTVEVLPGAGTNGRDLVRYTPPAGFTGSDAFPYTISGAGGTSAATATIDVSPLRPADTRNDPISGLRLRYYDLPALSALPDFSALEPISQEVSTSVNYASTNGVFINSGLSDDVGAVFDGYYWAFIDGLYTFTTESDDGSKLYIGDELVVDNDGLHGMESRSGSIALAAGHHRIRIEFFERGGGAGLIASIAGPGLTPGPIGGLLLSHDVTEACSDADLNADGQLDFFDVSALLNDSVDYNGDTAFDFFDISVFLQDFNAGCP
jgi:hypothetical protein